ncbi:MAG: hypothetical protein K2N98_00760 [Lachnospiraceae bacterium]|nr:hypothetical protein [Lachnospiraceae bacterium]
MTVDTALQAQSDAAYSIEAFSKETLAELDKRERAVRTALNGIDKNMEKVAFNLYWIYSNKAYKAMGCESITDYALDTFDLSKSSTYSFISLVERFAARSENGSITDKFDDKYKGYSSSKLSLLVNLTDEQIEGLDINPAMSVRDIKKRIKETDRGDAVTAPDKKGLSEKPEDVEDIENAQGTMKIEGNEISAPVSGAETGTDLSNDNNDDRTTGYYIDFVIHGERKHREQSWGFINVRYIEDTLNFHPEIDELIIYRNKK